MSNKKHDLMVDLETFGTDSNALVISISAVEFDLKTGKIGETYEVFLNKNEQVRAGAVIDCDTVDWWLSQDEMARNSLLKEKPVNVVNGLMDFHLWIEETFGNMKKIKLWGNGSVFDNVILRNLFKRHQVMFEIPYYCDRDVRTVVDLYNIRVREFDFEGIKHNGIDDCKHQIKYCSSAFKG